MKINDETEVLVDKLAIRRDVMTLGALVRNSSGRPGDVDIKLAVKFECATESRIMPFSITSVSFDERGNYIGYAVFDYELDVVFFHSSMNDFTVTVQAYDGNGYRDISVDDMSFNQVKDENEYACSLEQGVIHIRRKKPVKAIGNNLVIRLLALIYRVLEFLVGTLLIPLFLLDGIYIYVCGSRRRFMENTYGGGQLKRTLLFAKWRYSIFTRITINRETLKETFINAVHVVVSPFHKKDHILFLSTRRRDLTGNIAFVNDVLQDRNAKVLFWFVPGKTKYMTYGNLFNLACKLAKSKVVVVDDFAPILNDVHAMKKKILVQLWHACGAFKTFGFSRVGKDGGPYQTEDNHRYYNYAIVSSGEIRRFYAEGFGIDIKNVKALGMPRTDDFFREEYKRKIREELYNAYPGLKGKKVILFAPTFRGNGAGSAYYPFERFDVQNIMSRLPDDYALIIKHHPFVEDKHPIDASFKERVLDLSGESEINDLLFITDILITDYSSVIFEASLLNIPMLFYAFDLEDYIVSRDFYYPFRSFVPGKIVRDDKQIVDSIQNNDCEQDKVIEFRNRSFDDLDGRASERVGEFIMSLMD